MSLKMRGEVLDEVVKRLRSGEYKQGHSALRRLAKDGGPDLFCCLGVMCEIAVEEGVLVRLDTDVPGTSYGYKVPGQDATHTAYLPPAVIEWAGVVSDQEKEASLEEYHYEERGSFDVGSNDSLTAMNDNGKHDFLAIADWMEANVERV